MGRKLYQLIAGRVQAIQNCIKSGNVQWQERHCEALRNLIMDHLPHGSGFDSGVALDTKATANRLVFNVEYHHMSDAGYYDDWSSHQVIVTPDLSMGFEVRVTGRDRNQIKDYIADVFCTALNEEIDASPRRMVDVPMDEALKVKPHHIMPVYGKENL
jgi:hypothetical protein